MQIQALQMRKYCDDCPDCTYIFTLFYNWSETHCHTHQRIREYLEMKKFDVAQHQ